MRLKLCLTFLCCLAAVVDVQSEARIEVDENGDEYEVKRFNIEGRQMNGGRRQCVETRRKRSAYDASKDTASNAGYYNNNDDGDASENDNNIRKDEMQLIDTQTAPADDVDINEQVDGGDDIDSDDAGQSDLILPINEDELENNAPIAGLNNEAGNDGNDDYDYDYDNADVDDNGSVQYNKPLVTQQVALQNLNANGIVVYESHEPPKVDPEKNAVFQLLPVNHALHAAANYHENGQGDLQFEEEISPVSTIGIWSTGAGGDADDDNLLSHLYDEYEEDNNKNKKKKAKPNKIQRKPNRRPAKKPKKKPNKNSNKNRNPMIRKKQRRPMKGNRRPMKRKGNVGNKNSNNMDTKNKKKKKNIQKKKNKRYDQNSLNRDIKRRKVQNDLVKDKGSAIYTQTETYTRTGTAADQPEVNCIIIRKDPPPTTARPFWNILGRSAGDIDRSSQFGKRKRINLRIVPKEQ